MIAEAVPGYIWHPQSLYDTEIPVWKSKARESRLCGPPSLICLSLFQDPNSSVIPQANSIAVHNISHKQSKLYANPWLNWMSLVPCHRKKRNESVSCFLLCFVSLSQEKKNTQTFIHSTQTLFLSRSRIKVLFVYIDIQIRKIQLTSCAFDYSLANKTPKCGKNFLKAFEPEIGGAKSETWSWFLVAGRDLTTHSMLWVTQPHTIGTSNRIPCLVKGKVPFKCNMIF